MDQDWSGKCLTAVQEHLVQHVKILALVYDQVTVEHGVVEKWNLCCYGYMTITDSQAVIR